MKAYGPRLYRRHAFLKRNPSLSRAEFSSHYEGYHGPLAASLSGFRKYVSRYLQNHVEELPGGVEPLFDGVTMTTQVPREDYSRGFSSEPDCQEVLRPDECYLFDLANTIAVLGREEVAGRGDQSPYKAIILGSATTIEKLHLLTLPKRVLNHLDRSTADRLGRGSGEFRYDLLAEVWFETRAARDEAVGKNARITPDLIVLPVRELLIFGPEKPWHIVA